MLLFFLPELFIPLTNNRPFSFGPSSISKVLAFIPVNVLIAHRVSQLCLIYDLRHSLNCHLFVLLRGFLNYSIQNQSYPLARPSRLVRYTVFPLNLIRKTAFDRAFPEPDEDLPASRRERRRATDRRVVVTVSSVPPFRVY